MFNDISLGNLIDFLKTLEPDKIIKNGFGKPHSDRGSYDELAFEPKENITIKEMLDFATSADGQTFRGYKGGDYVMSRNTPVYIGYYGNCGDGITQFHFEQWRREATGTELLYTQAELNQAVKEALDELTEAVCNRNKAIQDRNSQ